MTLQEHLEKREKSRFDVNLWLDRLINAQSARNGWDDAYVICQKIRANQIPIMDTTSELLEFTDKLYRDNWLMKANVWKESFLQASDVVVDVKSKASADDTDPSREHLEMEINYAMDEFDMIRRGVGITSDQIWFGFGVSYLNWNAARVDKNWRTGVPDFRYLDCRCYWPDEAANERAWANRRWEFAKLQMDVEDAKEEYPEFADRITEIMTNSVHGDANERRDVFDVYLCQYKRTIRVDMVDVNYTDNGETHSEQVYYKEVEDYLADEEKSANLPDNVFIGDRYVVEKECWFQFFFSPDLSVALTDIEYIGDRDFFQFFWGMQSGIDIYPRSWTYFCADLLDIKVVAMTLAAVQAIKNGNPMPMVEQGSIRNFDEFRTSKNSLDFIAEIDAEWRAENPGAKPITFAEGKYDANISVMLNSLINEAIKSSTGSIDVTRGEAPFAGMSGVQTAQLQSAANVYTKQDELAYRDYLRQLSELLLQFVGTFRTYEHQLRGVSDTGEQETQVINPGNVVKWDWEKYYCVPMVQNDPEAIKQIKKQEAVQLKQMGAIGTVRMLSMLDYTNAEQMWQEALQENGVMGIVQALMEDPQLMQTMQAIISNPDLLSAITSGTGSADEPRKKKEKKS